MFDGEVGDTASVMKPYIAYPHNELIAKYDTLSIGGQEYYDVVHFQTEPAEFSFLNGERIFEYFWTEDGMVRWDIKDEQGVVERSWQLVRSNIIR